MEPLQQFIQGQAAKGSYQDSGSFVVDYSRARDKSRRYQLARSEQWVGRLLQAFSRLESTTVDFKMTRKSLRAEADVGKERFCGLSDMFRRQEKGSPAECFRDAVWGALNRGLVVELSWWDSGARTGFVIDGNSIVALPPKPDTDRRLCFLVKPVHQGNLLYKLFGKVDFSPEFHEIANVGFLVPYHLNLDGRAYDFESEYATQLLARGSEIRVKKALGEPLIKAPVFLGREARTLTGQRLDSSFDYHFLLQIRWNERIRRPQAHWVMDGVCIETVPLKSWESPLWLDLYLPAQGLETDLTGLKLVETEGPRSRLQELERFAAYTLMTVPPLAGAVGGFPGIVETEVRRFAKETLEEEMAIGLFRVKDETQEQQNRLDMAREIHRIALREWQRSKLMHEQVEAAKADYRSQCEERFDAVAGWGKLGVGRPEEDPAMFSEPMPERQKVKKFFGETYVRIAGGATDSEERSWLKKTGRRRQ